MQTFQTAHAKTNTHAIADANTKGFSKPGILPVLMRGDVACPVVHVGLDGLVHVRLTVPLENLGAVLAELDLLTVLANPTQINVLRVVHGPNILG